MSTGGGETRAAAAAWAAGVSIAAGAVCCFLAGGCSAGNSAGANFLGVPSLAESACASGLATVSLPIEKGASIDTEDRLSASCSARGGSTAGGAASTGDAGVVTTGGGAASGVGASAVGGGAGVPDSLPSCLASSALMCCHSWMSWLTLSSFACSGACSVEELLGCRSCCGLRTTLKRRAIRPSTLPRRSFLILVTAGTCNMDMRFGYSPPDVGRVVRDADMGSLTSDLDALSGISASEGELGMEMGPRSSIVADFVSLLSLRKAPKSGARRLLSLRGIRGPVPSCSAAGGGRKWTADVDCDKGEGVTVR